MIAAQGGLHTALGAPIFIRIFKESHELELWVQRGERYYLFRKYPIAYFSGGLGPKLEEGDQQAPEGFYAVSPQHMNPWSNFHLAFNVGYLNQYDLEHNASSGLIMIHGKRESIGCFALKSKSLPKAFDGFKIAQVSDLQSQEFGLGQRDLISAVRRSRADIIVITGDLLDRNHTDFGLATEALEGLLKLAPVYYVNGNHELSVAEDEMTDYYEQMRAMGVHVLLDRAEKIFRGGETIEILGISEDSVFGAKEIGYEHGADYADAVLAKSVQILKAGYGNGKEDEVDNAAKKCFSILLTTTFSARFKTAWTGRG